MNAEDDEEEGLTLDELEDVAKRHEHEEDDEEEDDDEDGFVVDEHEAKSKKSGGINEVALDDEEINEETQSIITSFFKDFKSSLCSHL